MYLVVANTGNWDYDMWGVIGVVKDPAFLTLFVKRWGGYSDDQMERAEIVRGTGACYASFEEHEVNFLCEGEPELYVLLEEPGMSADIYYLVKLEEQHIEEGHVG